MINEVDESLRALVRAEVVSGADIEVAFDAPTREWASRRNTPTVDLYLYDIREDLRRRSVGVLERRDERGVVVDRKVPPRHFKLAYLITAWTQRPEDEHRILSAVLSCFLRYDVLPDHVLTPALASLGYPVGLQIATPPPDNQQVPDVWSSLGGDLKPSVDLAVTLVLHPERLQEIAKVVMAPLRLRSRAQVTLDSDDGSRHLPASRFPALAEAPLAVPAPSAETSPRAKAASARTGASRPPGP